MLHEQYMGFRPKIKNYRLLILNCLNNNCPFLSQKAHSDRINFAAELEHRLKIMMTKFSFPDNLHQLKSKRES